MRDFAFFLSTKTSQPKMPGAFHFFGRQCYRMLPHRLRKGFEFWIFLRPRFGPSPSTCDGLGGNSGLGVAGCGGCLR